MERHRSPNFSEERAVFEDFLWPLKNGLIDTELPIDKRVYFSETTPCHIKNFTGVLTKDVSNMAYQIHAPPMDTYS